MRAPKKNYWSTPTYKRMIRIGASIAKQLPVVMGPQECAKKLGISPQLLYRQECIALYKVRTQMIKLMGTKYERTNMA